MERKSTRVHLKATVLLVAFGLTLFSNLFAQADLTRPTVVSVSPTLLSLDAGTTISAVFSESMNAATINSSTVELRNALTGSLVPATVVYTASTRTAKLYPVSALNSLLFTAKIRGGSSGVKDVAGNYMLNDYSWSFIMLPLYDFTAPTLLSVTPSAGATGVNVSTQLTAVFSENMNASTISTGTFELRTSANVLVQSTVTYNASMRTAVLVPALPLATNTTYKATVKGSQIRDTYNNAVGSDYSWTFTTAAPADGVAPYVTGVSPSNGSSNVSIASSLSAIFSEAVNATTVNSSTFELRTSSGSLVPGNVAYNATTRTASFAPLASLPYNTSFTATVKGGASGVKDLAGNALASNYTWTFTTVLPPDNVAPTVVSTNPVQGAIEIPLTVTPVVQFSEALNASTVNTSTVQLTGAGNTITATVAYNSANNSLTVTPSSPLSNAVNYTLRVKGGSAGVKDLAGNALAVDYTGSFTTVAFKIFGDGVTPVVPTHNDAPAEIGVKFRASVSGYVTGVRFYKGPGNEGTHIGHLWSSAGVMLAEANFTNESASGWQQVSFSNPVSINAGVTYVASYFSVPGIYSYTNNYFTSAVVNGPVRALADGEDGGNGVYKYSSSSIFPDNSYNASNYFVDVLFTTSIGPDVIAPTVMAVSPAAAASNVNTASSITAVMSEALNAGTVSNATVELRTSGGALVAATVTYNAASNTITLTPASTLSTASAYTAKIKGGSAGIKDVAGNSMASDYSWSFSTAEPLIAPADGPGGPILVVSAANNPYSRYAVEILRAEGLNEFAAADIATINAQMLSGYDVVVLGEMAVTASQVTLLTDWVNAGGTLIAFKPTALLAPLMGLSTASGTLTDKYLLVNQVGPGAGIVSATMQYHGTANLHTITGGSGATAIATLYSNASTATGNPAVTMRPVGVNGGAAIAFTYDLARSIVYTRQGNPAWAGQKRDGQIDPIRSDDMFFPDWVDFNKIAIPQADEQQRLLANIILQGNMDRKPLPRFWYLPRDLKAAVVMTGDNHGTSGTLERFEHFKSLGPNSPSDVADWKAVRATAYTYASSPLTIGQAAQLQADGFEIALHPNTGCQNYTLGSLQNTYSSQLSDFRANYPPLAPPATNRNHCLVWSDWASTPKAEYQNGIRLDVTYYYWPEAWMHNTPGMFTGSGMPMRFADMDGSLIDVYQAPTQITDETNMNYTSFCNTVLDNAIGSNGYYGVFTTNLHTDVATSTAASDAIIASAQARQVPVISARQLLTWVDSRNASSFGNITWNNNQLSFTINAKADARNLRAMLPTVSAGGTLISVSRDGVSLPLTNQTIKGIQYAFFSTDPGIHNYVAVYGVAARMQSQPVTTELPAPAVTETVKKDAYVPGELFGKVYPNPSGNYFNLVINSSNEKPVSVRVTDISGRTVEIYPKLSASSILRLGQSWGAGTYFAELVQGDQKKVVKLVKVN